MAGLDPVDLARQIAPLNRRISVRVKPNTRQSEADEGMPYESVDDLPDAVQQLPEAKQQQFRAVFNNALKQYGEESRAFAVAWAAVGGAPKKDKEASEGLRRDQRLLDRASHLMQCYEVTAGSKKLMLFPRGRYQHPEYGEMDFDDNFFGDIVGNFDGKALGQTEPFIDVDHNHGAACGWIKQLSVEPDGLYATVDWTPLGKELVTSGQYRYFSPWWGSYKEPHSGKTYQRVLRGGGLTNVPFLKVLPPVELFEPGVASPARQRAWTGGVTFKLSEVTPLYLNRDGGVESLSDRVRIAFNDRFGGSRTSFGPASSWVREIYDGAVVAAFEEPGGVRYFRIPYTPSADGVTFHTDERAEVREGWLPVTGSGLSEEALLAELKARYGPTHAAAHVLRQARIERALRALAQTRRAS